MPPLRPLARRPLARRTLALAALALAALAAVASGAGAATWKLDAQRSVVAVLTHKAGVGARLAHDHLVVAPLAAVALDFDAERPAATRLTVAARAEALEIDAPAARQRWGARLSELGALAAGGLKAVPEGDRKKVREAMLSAGQLDAARFPEIRAELLGLEPRAASAAGAGDPKTGPAFDWTARVKLTLRGKTVEKELAARWRLEAGELTAEAMGELRFSELGIEPYSTLLGAIRNDDRVHLFVAFAARPEIGVPAGAPGGSGN